MTKKTKKRLMIVALVWGTIYLVLFGGFRPSVTFTVLDDETKKPIAGAVAIAWWSSYRGLPGLSYGVTDKVVERETGSDGTFKIPLIFGRLARQVPRIKIYKPGYVGWDSCYIYLGHWKHDIKMPSLDDRENFKYMTQEIYLEPWKDEYSYMSHDLFLVNGLPPDFDRVGLRRLRYQEAIRYEIPFLNAEREKISREGGGNE